MLFLIVLLCMTVLVHGADGADEARLVPIAPVPLPSPVVKRSVTLVYDFERPPADLEVVTALKAEIEDDWKMSGFEFDWRPMDALQAGDSFPDLVVVHFKGSCELRPSPAVPPESDVERSSGSALAYSPVVDGRIQPFSSVLCDRVQHLLAPAVDRRPGGDALLGRALGRVLSHELYHILNQTRQHAKSGLAKSRLSGAQLIDPGFHFTAGN